ncbi:MAG: hypothetical protein JO359_00580 [Candidatus Eremiobacteraeota bacterium]|nr:hypothetical protein [Candidatus Eremiobacteraeota bacterium]
MKLLLAGHNVKLVCRTTNAEAINRNGIRVRLPISGRADHLEIDSRELPGQLSADVPQAIDPGKYDFGILAMQEPHYGAPGVRELLDEVAKRRIPCVSLMNMPPPPYLRRIPTIDVDSLDACYTDPSVWRNFNPNFMTLCSPDPQTFRLVEQGVTILQVTLPTNFKAARFESDEHTEILRSVQSHIGVARFYEMMELPVKLKVFDSVFVPLAKWPMLITGNYRCVKGAGAPSPIRDAVHADIDTSRAVYEWVASVCTALGAAPEDLVPFEKYAKAAQGLANPSSASKALYEGAKNIERVDRLVQTIASQRGMRSEVLDGIVARVDGLLAKNREGVAV